VDPILLEQMLLFAECALLKELREILVKNRVIRKLLEQEKKSSIAPLDYPHSWTSIFILYTP
jgi:hypothetical protein